MNLQQFTAPFEPGDIEFRAGSTNGDKTKALALAYITSRAVMDRLDQVVGPENWRDQYRAGPSGGVLCGISIRINDEWVCKYDGAENTAFEAVKGGLSDAFKRAAVKWGIGRYLYSLPAVWVSCQVKGKSVIIDQDEARARILGQRPTNGTNGNGHSPGTTFGSIGELLEALHQQTGASQEVCKAALKEAGFTTFARSRSAEMYRAGLDQIRTF